MSVFIWYIVHAYDDLIVAEQCWRASEWNDLLKDDRLNKVHIIEQAVSAQHCNYIIEEALNYVDINGWETERHNPGTETTDINTIVSDKLNNFIVNITQSFYPKFVEFYGIPMGFLTIFETFVVKYEFKEGAQSDLKGHMDASQYSYVLALNDPNEYEGGGTRFIEKDETIYKVNKGDVVIFPGKLFHEGVKITKGKRFILAGFLNIISDYHCSEIMDKKEIIITNHLDKKVEMFWDDQFEGVHIDDILPHKWIRLQTYNKHH
eukprot:184417_1